MGPVSTGVVAVSLLAVLLLGGTVVTAQAPWCTITVSSSDSLRDAVSTLPPGSIVCLEPGLYEAGFEISRDLTLRGVGRADSVILTSNGTVDRPVLSLYPNYGSSLVITLENLTLTGAVAQDADATAPSADGLVVNRDTHVLLRRVVCTENDGAGITVDRDATLLATDCAFTANGYGAFLDSGASARFEDCVFSSNAAGAVLGQDGQTWFQSCTVKDNSEIGIAITTGQATLDHCSLDGNGWGIVLGAARDEPPQLRMNACTILGSLHAGIALMDSACFDPRLPARVPVQVSGKRNAIPSADAENGNAGGGLCPEYPGDPWPPGFVKE